MNNSILKALSPIFLLAILTGCESGEDVARKGGLIDGIVSNSLRQCDLQKNLPQEIPYEERLRTALGKARSTALDEVIETGTTICLDQRLSTLKTGFFDSNIRGVFYNNTRNPVVTLWDDGKDPEQAGIFSTSVTSYSGNAVDKLKDSRPEPVHNPLEEEQALENNIKLGAMHSCGKNCTTFKWKSKTAHSSIVEKNPAIMSPPLG